MSRPSSHQIRRVINTYAHSDEAGQSALTAAQLAVQTERALGIVQRLTGVGHTVVLDDPVGTGKTVVALAAASELLRTGQVDNVLVVCPNAAVAGRWQRRAASAGLTTAPRIGRRRGVLTTVSSRRIDRAGVPASRRERLLVMVDEAHRGLHNDQSQQHLSVRAVALGARVLLITATPWQMSATGLRNMLGVGQHALGPEHAKIHALGTASARLVEAEHRIELAGDAASDGYLEARRHAQAEYDAALADAQRVRERVFLPPYDREKAGLPKRFTLPPPLPVAPTAAWAEAFHVARLVPELLPTTDGDPVRNSDTFMRMLVSSHAALRASRAWKTFVGVATSGTARHLRHELECQLVQDHPKVAFTAREAFRRVRAGRHVLIFCYFTATPAELEDAIRSRGGNGMFRVERATNETQARRIHASGFNRPAGITNPPIVLIVGDALTESVDLDGGRPVVIHHDLTWSPVAYDQRMGRVVRISTNFEPVALRDVVIPILECGLDQRMYDTLKGRRMLAELAVPT